MEAGEYEDPSSTALGTGELDRTKSPEVETAVSEKRLRTLNEELLQVPGQLHDPPQAAQAAARGGSRCSTTGAIEFGHAEALAFASLLTEGTHIRLTGQDTERGTFSQPPPGLHDEKTGLQVRADPEPVRGAGAVRAPQQPALGERACLGFEYGYSAASPESLILWEAQFGDFANSAQVIIDSFIVAGESKWGQTDAADAAAPARLRGRRPRALERPDRALHPARRRGQHPAREPDHGRPVLPPAAPPGADREAAAAGRVHAEGPAAAARRRRRRSAT